MLSGVVGIFMIGFGILWTVLAMQINGFFALFGILWTCIAVVITVYNFNNAIKKNRYSQFDITDGKEEPDPLNAIFGETCNSDERRDGTNNKFCPYCGTSVDSDFEFCNNCGKKLP